MSPSMEKERVDHQVLNPVLSRTEPDRNTLAADQIRLDAFFGISVYKHLERCVGTHPEKLWVKIPNYFCLSAYRHPWGNQQRGTAGRQTIQGHPPGAEQPDLCCRPESPSQYGQAVCRLAGHRRHSLDCRLGRPLPRLTR